MQAQPTERPPVVCPVCGKRYTNPGPLAICIGTPEGSHAATVMVAEEK